jgi:glycerophosphoryl diester phosphodiesterase
MPRAGKNRPLLLGHRGARALKSIPENTLASFDQALADGCDGFEFDVRLTSDSMAVIGHDPHWRSVEIARASIEELSELPRLERVLALYRERAFLDVELKVGGLEEITAGLLRRFRPRRGFVVSSFLPEVLRGVHAQDATLPIGLICETKAELRHSNRLPLECVIPHHRLVDSALIAEWKAAKKRILVWTVNSAVDMLRFRDWGVDGIISDDTKLLSRTLGE